MLNSQLPEALQLALTTTTGGATGVSRLAIDGLLELAGTNPAALPDVADDLFRRRPGYAPLWHVARAVREPDPAGALLRLRAELDEAVSRSIDTAIRWLDESDATTEIAPSSSIVAEILARRSAVSSTERSGPIVGLCGAAAIGPAAVLNIVGTDELSCSRATVIVTTSTKLVPEEVFDRLGTPAFEKIPLGQFEAVVLDGELLSPAEAGSRAAQVAGL